MPLPLIQGASSFLVAFVLVTLITSLAYPAFRSAVLSASARLRSLLMVLYAFLVPIVAVAAAVIGVFPALSSALAVPHCHGDSCSGHAPLMPTDSLGSYAMLALLMVLGALAVIITLRLLSDGQRRLRTLFALSETTATRKPLVVQSDRPFAWCCGLIRQRIVISTALIKRLSGAELAAVEAHENAHMRRHDNLRLALGRTFTACWPATRRQQFLDSLLSDNEVASDELARKSLEDPAVLTQALQRLAMPHSHETARGALLTSAAVERVNEAVVATSGAPEAMRALLAFTAIWLLTFVTVAVVNHPLLEWVSGLSWH